MYAPNPVPTPLERELVDATPAPRARGGGPLPARKPHVCFVAPTTWPLFSGDRNIPVIGGAEMQQSIIAPALAARGYRVSMISLDWGQPDRTVLKGVTVHKTCKPDEGVPVLRFFHPRLTSLWRTLRRVDADVYYQRTSAATTGFMAEFCRRNGKRSIYSGASDPDFVPGEQDILYARDRWIFEHGLRHVDRIFAQNLTQQELARRHYGRESVVIPNCYDAPAGAKADPRGYILWVATMRSSKRAEMLLEMARRLPAHRFVMVGGSDMDARAMEYYEGIKAEARKIPNLDFRGFVPFAEADGLFDGARLVLNTSKYEGFPNTFLQAWARGAPTVAFIDTRSRAADGAPPYEIVRDLEHATATVDRLMRDDVAWQRASARVLEHFRATHSVDAVVALYEREIDALASRP